MRKSKTRQKGIDKEPQYARIRHHSGCNGLKKIAQDNDRRQAGLQEELILRNKEHFAGLI